MTGKARAPAGDRGDGEWHRLATADGAAVAYAALGPTEGGQPVSTVLFVHGLASNASRYSEFVEQTSLQRRHRLLRVDLRGHGAASTRGRCGIEEWCADLRLLLSHESSGLPAIVVGHSLGAQVALNLARRHPECVRALVLVDPVFRRALHGRWRWIARAAPAIGALAAIVRLFNRAGLHRRELEPLDLRQLDALAREALRSPDAEAAFIARYSSTRADLRHVPLAVYLQDLAAMFAPAPLPRDLGLPVLALLSTGATFADAGAMQGALTGPLVTVQAVDCHHWPLTERPAEVRDEIERWVGTLGSAR